MLCILVICSKRGFAGGCLAIYQGCVVNFVDMLSLGVPSVLYVCNNVMMFKAISHLDAATFQLTYQVKVGALPGTDHPNVTCKIPHRF